MTRTMYDAIDVANLPPGGDLYAGYDDGRWPDAPAIAARFPGKEVLRITVSPSDDQGVIGDGPPDNGTWPQWVTWVGMRRAAGVDPWINTNASSWQAGKDAFAAAQVVEPHWWIADYDNDPTIPPGALMKQYASNADYDTSSAADYLPGIDPAPTSAAPAASTEEDEMAIYPIQVGPNPTTGAPWSCGVASWPAGPAGQPGIPHVLQLVADPGGWGDTEGQFRLDFDMESGPDVDTIVLAKPAESVALELASVPGYNPALCRGVLITRPDGKKWPWGGHAS